MGEARMAADRLARASAGRRMAINTAMIPMTTRISTSVKPRGRLAIRAVTRPPADVWWGVYPAGGGGSKVAGRATSWGAGAFGGGNCYALLDGLDSAILGVTGRHDDST